MTCEIDERGFWRTNDCEWHCYDEPLAHELAMFFVGHSVVDFGCGPGDYIRCFDQHGIRCNGFDGNPHTPQLSAGRCGVLDLSEHIELEQTYDWVLSLEVGEHIPARHEATFIDNLHRHNTLGLVLSWAIPGQGGRGHVNERSNDYVKACFKSLGYMADDVWERRFREVSTRSWFKRTIIVFRKPPRPTTILPAMNLEAIALASSEDGEVNSR